METVYTDYQGGRWVFWTYSDYQRVFISERTARMIVRQGGRMITSFR